MAFFSLWPMWCLVCGHLVHAMRQVAQSDDVNPIDNMFCECKEVYSVKECPDYGKTKFGLSSGTPRYYHEQAQNNLCCRMSTNSTWRWRMWKKKKYIRQDTKDLCLEEGRPFGGCCTVAGSAEIYGEDLKIHLTHAKFYSMAHKKMNGNPTEKDYKKKSSKVFIETDSIGYGTSFDPLWVSSHIPADKIIPDIKKLMKTSEILQCKENFSEGVKNAYESRCVVLAKPICCCTEEALKKDLANHTDLCIGHKCGPKGIDWRVEAKFQFGKREGKEINGEFRDFIYDWKTVWPNFDPFSKCPEVLKHKHGITLAKKQGNEQMKGNCTGFKQFQVNWEGSRYHDKTYAKTYCSQKTYEPVCGAGEVAYRAFNGLRLDGALHCPAGYKSNIPNDRFDSKCNCDSQRRYRDNVKVTLEVRT